MLEVGDWIEVKPKKTESTLNIYRRQDSVKQPMQAVFCEEAVYLFVPLFS
jgi:hypothetical protein